MKKNKLNGKWIFTLLLGVALLTSVSAFGISTPYMEEINGVRTFEVYQSNSENFEVVLQSGLDEPMNVKVSILEGSEVIELLGNEDIFQVNPGEKVPVNFRIVSPEGAEIGDSFNVKLGFASSEEGSGALAFGTAIEKNFKVLLVEMPLHLATPEEEKSGKAALIISLGILALLVLLIIILKVRNHKPKVIEKKPIKKKAVAKKKKVAKKKTSNNKK
jgi:hypothetical protein